MQMLIPHRIMLKSFNNWPLRVRYCPGLIVIWFGLLAYAPCVLGQFDKKPGVYQREELRSRVLTPPSKPVAKINPGYLKVEQGKRAIFESQSTPEAIDEYRSYERRVGEQC